MQRGRVGNHNNHTLRRTHRKFLQPICTELVIDGGILCRFDPTFGMMSPSMRFMQPLFSPDELDSDEHGNVNWNLAWRKELNSLQQLTEEQEKAGTDQEWYRMMLFRLRSGMMMHPGEPVVHVGNGVPPPPHGMPPNPGEVPQE